MKTISLPGNRQINTIASDTSHRVRNFAWTLRYQDSTARSRRKVKLYFVSLALVIVMNQGVAWGQTTMAHFGLNNNLTVDNDNVVGTPTATNSGLSFGNTTTPVCEGTYYAYCDANDGNDYLQININTTGFSSISISWQQRWSATGTNTGSWILSGDANNDGTYEYSTTNSNVTGSCATITVTLGTSFNNQSAIRLRLTSNVTSGRYLLLDDITIKGCAAPTAYNVTGGGSTCSSGTGVAVGLANSETGVTYQLYLGGTTIIGTPVSGNTGSAISFGNHKIAGVYTVVATRISGACSTNMTGSATVTVSTPVSSVIGQTNITCNAAKDGKITVEASNGLAPYKFSVDDGATWQSATSGNTSLFTGLSPNNPYKIKVKDANECISK